MRDVDQRYIIHESPAQPRDMQVVFSHQVGHVHGDLAVTYGFQAVQVNSRAGKTNNGVSDKHDLAIEKVFGNPEPSGATKNKRQDCKCPRGHFRMHSRSRVVQNPFLILAADLRRLRTAPGLRDTWRDLSRLNSPRHRHHRRNTVLWLLAAGLRRLRKT